MADETVIGYEEMTAGLGVRIRFLLHGQAGARAPVLTVPINQPRARLVEALEVLISEVKDAPSVEPTRTVPFGTQAESKPPKPETTTKPKRRGRPPKPRN